MRQIGLLIMIAALALLNACSAPLGKTVAKYGDAYYESNKNQEGFSLKSEWDDTGKIKTLNLQTTATTPEAAIAAMAQRDMAMIEMFREWGREILPLLKAAAAGAATGVPAVPKPAPPPPKTTIP